MAALALHKITDGIYSDGSIVGRGGFGKVYKGLEVRNLDVLQGSPVAIKCCKRGDDLKTILKEWQNGRLLESVPHRLRMRCQAPGILVTDLLGENLAQAGKKGPFSYSIRISIIKQLLEFLKGAHDTHLVHGDIKPHNMSYDPASGSLTVFDYGESNQPRHIDGGRVAQDHKSRTPESLLEMTRGNVTFHIDMWSFGCLVFKLFSGCSLFEPGYTPLHPLIAINQLLHQIFEQLGDSGRPSWNMLHKCCQHLVSELFIEDEGGQVSLKHVLQPVETEEWRQISENYENYFNQNYEQNLARAKEDGDFKSAMEQAHEAMKRVYLTQERWQDRLRPHVPEDQLGAVLQLLEVTLKMEPEGRKLPAELLCQPGIFEQDVQFYLTLPPEQLGHSQDQIVFFSADAIDVDPSASPMVVVDRRVRIDHNCFHLPTKDSHDQYWVVVARAGEQILTEQITIRPGDRVVIQDNGTMSVRVMSRDQAIARVAPRALAFLSEQQEPGASGRAQCSLRREDEPPSKRVKE